MANTIYLVNGAAIGTTRSRVLMQLISWLHAGESYGVIDIRGTDGSLPGRGGGPIREFTVQPWELVI